MIRARFRLAFLILSAFAAALGRGQAVHPAFLDGADRIRVALESAVDGHAIPQNFIVRLDGKTIPVKVVRAAGTPTRERLLGRSPGRVVLAGSLQSALGGAEWDPDGERTQMNEFAPGVFELTVRLPKGRFEFKVARNGSWNENYGVGFVAGGANLAVIVPKDGTVVRFVVDFNRKLILDSINFPKEVTVPSTVPEGPEFDDAPMKYEAVDIILSRALTPEEITAPISISRPRGDSAERKVFAREVLNDKAFEYTGNDLGSRWTRAKTTFRVWSPVSRTADLLLFDKATGGTPRVLPMQRAENGTWRTEVAGDLHGKFYQYRFTSYGETRIATDIYCFAANADSTRSMVIDLARSNPAGWPVPNPPLLKQPTDAVLYELHVRDFTADPSSGVDAAKRGKYAGMVQGGTRVPGTQTQTGLDYLKNLGVTDIHLLPPQNFLLSHDGDYTWGYATNLFNVPEETYSMTPNDPVGVVREFKQMVAGFHRAGLRVVLDVVYNHTWPPDGKDSNFWQTVPYYYFRTNDRGDLLNESGVGNAFHDERPMARKFVRDSLLYWMNEYKIDGFRFDLIGMFSKDSVVDWTKAMRKLKPDVTLYGEPWTGGGPTRFAKGTQRSTGMAVFNDRFRGTFRGELDGAGAGFISGNIADRASLEKAITGWIDSKDQPDGFTDFPSETINYVSAHDNATLWDKLLMVHDNTADIERAIRFAGAGVLLSQGVPFLEGGAQIGRTKGGNHNSYNAGDAVNKYDWQRATRFADLNAYYRGLIALRRNAPEFRLATAGEVRKQIQFLSPAEMPGNRIAWRVGKYLVILNGEKKSGTVKLPVGDYDVLVDDKRAGIQSLRTAKGNLELAPCSAYVLRLR